MHLLSTHQAENAKYVFKRDMVNDRLRVYLCSELQPSIVDWPRVSMGCAPREDGIDMGDSRALPWSSSSHHIAPVSVHINGDSKLNHHELDRHRDELYQHYR